MKNKNNRNEINGTSDSLDIQVAKLAFIGTSITTLGDGISAIAAGLALDALVKSNIKSTQRQNPHLKQLETSQKQLDYLLNELKQFRINIR